MFLTKLLEPKSIFSKLPFLNGLVYIVQFRHIEEIDATDNFFFSFVFINFI